MLKTNAPIAGIYYLPFSERDHKARETVAFVNVLPSGLNMNMSEMTSLAIVGQLVAASPILLLLQTKSGHNYLQRVRYVALVGLTIGFLSHFSYWNWFWFTTPYVAVILVDSLIAWSLVSLVMTRFFTGSKQLEHRETDPACGGLSLDAIDLVHTVPRLHCLKP